LPDSSNAHHSPASKSVQASSSDPIRYIAPGLASSRFKRIWVGPDGVRAGWATCLFFVIVIGLAIAVGVVMHLLRHGAPRRAEITPGRTIVFELLMICVGLIGTKVMSLIERRSWLSYGLRAPHRLKHLGQGLGWGIAVMSAVIGILVLTHAVTLDVASSDPSSVLESALLWALAFGLVAVNEELVCRGYAFFTLTSGTNATVAAILLSVLFGAAHIHNLMESPSGVISAGLFGIVLSIAVWRTGSLWWAVGFHAAWEWTESFLFGAADGGQITSGHWLTTHAIGPIWLSGGSAGPEASVVVVPGLLATTLIIVLTLPRNPARWVRRAVSAAPQV